MNYWPPVDGVQELFEDHRSSSSEIVQRRLVNATVVKTLNHLGYHQLEDERRPAGSPERRVLGVAGPPPPAGEAGGPTLRTPRLHPGARRAPLRQPPAPPS